MPIPIYRTVWHCISLNPYHFPTATLKEVCHKITDGKHAGCEQETDSGYYYVGAREIYDGVIHYDTAPQITFADFAKDYRRCNIEQGDMVIVNTGATIKLIRDRFQPPHRDETLLAKSVALIKVKTDVISAKFLRYCYMANPSMYMVESASAQPNLLLSKMNATVIFTCLQWSCRSSLRPSSNRPTNQNFTVRWRWQRETDTKGFPMPAAKI